MATAAINRLIELFQHAFCALGVHADMQELERLGMVVHQCMGATSRAYHGSHHVLGLCEDAPPIQTLAALFHDTVYYQLDGGLPPALTPFLRDAIVVQDGNVILAVPQVMAKPEADGSAGDLLHSVVQVFGYQYGDTLPSFGGMNEFLSAVAAVRLLARFVPASNLIHIAACIEATIPFRPDDSNGQSALDRLGDRLKVVLQGAPFGMPPTAARSAAMDMVNDAMQLANRDVAGFAEPNPAVFLAQTWLLIEESNKPLASAGLYTLREYRTALQRMDGFLANLDPTAVFQQFQGAPDALTVAELTKKASSNIHFSVRYLRAKLLAMGVLEALADLSGGDAPISMFLGEFSAEGGAPGPKQTPNATNPNTSDIDPQLLHVLVHGRAHARANDSSASPTAAFIYQSLGDFGVHAQWLQACRYFAGTIAPLEFLQQLPGSIAMTLLEHCATNALSRRDRLAQLQNTLLLHR